MGETYLDMVPMDPNPILIRKLIEIILKPIDKSKV